MDENAAMKCHEKWKFSKKIERELGLEKALFLDAAGWGNLALTLAQQFVVGQFGKIADSSAARPAHGLARRDGGKCAE